MALFPAIRFDGRTALAQAVDVQVDGRTLEVFGPSRVILDRVELTPARVAERFLHAPRIIALDAGATLEVADPDGRFAHALESAGVLPTAVQRIQQFWPAALTALVGVIGLVAFAYLRGVPAAAHWLALRLPETLEQRVGDEVLVQLDQHLMRTSRLAPERRDAINRRFAQAAATVAPEVRYQLAFRRIDGAAGVNAMALPGGTIVVLDGLVDIIRDDDALVGVLSHELGHVAGKHSLRQLLQSLGIGALAGLVWGDFSAVVANVPLAFGVLHYSRQLEEEADDFAIAVLKGNGISTLPLLRFFDDIEALSQKRPKRRDIPAFFSSHPATAARQQRLREADGR